MRQFDGLRPNTHFQSSPKPSLPSAPPKKPGPRRNGVFLFAILPIVVLAFFARSGKQSSNAVSPAAIANAEPGAGDRLTLPQDTIPNANQALEGIVILDQPKADSLPQEAVPAQATPSEPAEQPAAQAFTLRILNGSGVSGAAATMQSTLEHAGLSVMSIGTALNGHTITTLYHLPGKREFAESVAVASGRKNVRYVEDTVASPADVLLVIGAE